MNGFADLIVWMWLLPVTLFIGLPLAMLASRLLWRAIAPHRQRLPEAIRGTGTCTPALLVQAGA